MRQLLQWVLHYRPKTGSRTNVEESVLNWRPQQYACLQSVPNRKPQQYAASSRCPGWSSGMVGLNKLCEWKSTSCLETWKFELVLFGVFASESGLVFDL